MTLRERTHKTHCHFKKDPLTLTQQESTDETSGEYLRNTQAPKQVLYVRYSLELHQAL